MVFASASVVLQAESVARNMTSTLRLVGGAGHVPADIFRMNYGQDFASFLRTSLDLGNRTAACLLAAAPACNSTRALGFPAMAVGLHLDLTLSADFDVLQQTRVFDLQLPSAYASRSQALPVVIAMHDGESGKRRFFFCTDKLVGVGYIKTRIAKGSTRTSPVIKGNLHDMDATL